jgi:hypothetical protein
LDTRHKFGFDCLSFVADRVSLSATARREALHVFLPHFQKGVKTAGCEWEKSLINLIVSLPEGLSATYIGNTGSPFCLQCPLLFVQAFNSFHCFPSGQDDEAKTVSKSVLDLLLSRIEAVRDAHVADHPMLSIHLSLTIDMALKKLGRPAGDMLGFLYITIL